LAWFKCLLKRRTALEKRPLRYMRNLHYKYESDNIADLNLAWEILGYICTFGIKYRLSVLDVWANHIHVEKYIVCSLIPCILALTRFSRKIFSFFNLCEFKRHTHKKHNTTWHDHCCRTYFVINNNSYLLSLKSGIVIPWMIVFSWNGKIVGCK